MRLALGLCALCCCPPAWAGPTGLNTIPTTDLVPLRQLTAVVQNGNSSLQDSPTLFEQPQFLPQLQFGLHQALEGGMDAVPGRAPGHYVAQINFKWRAVVEDYGRPAVAVGFVQPFSESSTSYYLVASRTLNFARLQYQKFRAHHRNIKLRGRRVHAGITSTPSGTFPLLGTDWELSDQFVVYSDWISGASNAVSLGGVYVVNQANSLAASLLYGNHAQRINGLLINYTRTTKW
jgi:hypothetical protein